MIISMNINRSLQEEHLKQIIDGCLKGERQSQNYLYNLFASKMFLVCLRYAKNREEAKEILQEGFIKVFTSIGQYKFLGSFEGWMRKIMVNCALQKYKGKAKLYSVIDIEAAPLGHLSCENVTSRLDTKEILQHIQKLPPAYRMVFNLYVFEGLKHREIAEQLGISEGTSKSNLSDARTILQKAINQSVAAEQRKIKCI